MKKQHKQDHGHCRQSLLQALASLLPSAPSCSWHQRGYTKMEQKHDGHGLPEAKPGKTTRLAIEGMHCASCANIITRGLKKVPGVQEANVNYGTHKATVIHDAAVQQEQLVQAVNSKGYGAHIIAGDEKVNYQEQYEKKEYAHLKQLFIISLVFSVPALLIG